MAHSTMLHVRVDDEIKAQATEALAAMGLSVSDAVRILLKRVVNDQAFPLELKVPNAQTRAAMEEARAMAKARAARFDTADALIDDLEKARQRVLALHVDMAEPRIELPAIAAASPLRRVVLTSFSSMMDLRHRLMFAFSRNGEPLKVYGRKFPVFDNALLRKKRWRAVAATAKPIVYLPFTDDTLDPGFVDGGREYLSATARKASDELRKAGVPSSAFPGELLADVIPIEVVTTLAVIEQTDDADFREKGNGALDEVLSQYGLKRQEAYRYSVSSAAALGPMQFTNRRGNGTYALVVRRCARAGIDPDFERGATNLLNAMKAAICLLDIELSQMQADIRLAYRENPAVLGIFPVAAYNGGPRNVAKLYRALRSMRVQPGELRRAGEQAPGKAVPCPCVWKEDAAGIRPVTIPRYNNENRWYVEKYQSTLGVFEPAESPES